LGARGPAESRAPEGGSREPSQDKAAHDAAREMVRLAITDEAFNVMLDQVGELIGRIWWATAGEATKAAMAQRGANISPEDETRMKALMKVIARKVFLELYPRSRVVESVASVWEQHLTASEMTEIVRFYRTPVGRKALGLSAKMMMNSPEFSGGVGTTSEKFWERAKDELMVAAAATSVTPVGSPGVTPPELIADAKPAYTVDALKAKIEGVVRLRCIINSDGTVGEVAVTQSLDTVFGLDEEAIKAAKKWTFKPGRKNDVPVPVLVELEITFKLRRGMVGPRCTW
jgi:TonB family protein